MRALLPALGLLLGIACARGTAHGGETPRPATTPVAIATIEEPADPVDPPPPPRPCGPAIAAMDALFGVGNRWRYVNMDGWHSATEASFVDESVLESRRVGEMRVAALALAYQPWPNEDAAMPAQNEYWPERLHRIQRDDATYRVTCLPEELEAATEESLNEAIRACGEAELPGDTTRAQTACGVLGCAQLDHRGAELEDEAWLWPGVGLAVTARPWYSAETGDGRNTQRFLVGFDLMTAAHTVGQLADEPDDFAVSRQAVHAAASGGDIDALRGHLHDDVQFSLNTEHRSPDFALAAWAGDNGAALALLRAVTQAPCAALGDVVLCPAEEARRIAALTGTCRAEFDLPPPRAVFARDDDGGWKMTAFLVGGVDDHWIRPEWSARSPLPWSQRERF